LGITLCRTGENDGILDRIFASFSTAKGIEKWYHFKDLQIVTDENISVVYTTTQDCDKYRTTWKPQASSLI
jgi:hypothetical protein